MASWPSTVIASVEGGSSSLAFPLPREAPPAGAMRLMPRDDDGTASALTLTSRSSSALAAKSPMRGMAGALSHAGAGRIMIASSSASSAGASDAAVSASLAGSTLR